MIRKKIQEFDHAISRKHMSQETNPYFPPTLIPKSVC